MRVTLIAPDFLRRTLVPELLLTPLLRPPPSRSLGRELRLGRCVEMVHWHRHFDEDPHITP